MERFTELVISLDQTNKTNEKVALLADYFRMAPADDAAWSIYFLTGRRLKRLVPTRQLRVWATECSGLPSWLVDESYQAVGDLAETVALLLPPPEGDLKVSLASCVESSLLPMRGLAIEEQREIVVELWRQLADDSRFVLNKLLTGGFRLGVSQKLVVRALSQVTQLPTEVLFHRMMGDWEPTARWYEQLVDPNQEQVVASRPFPFLLAQSIDRPLEELGGLQNWQVEWKWDGIRAQVIRRQGQSFLWSRGEELMENRFPELDAAIEQLPDGTVLDGEILGYDSDRPLAFSRLQTRLNRKRVTPKVMADCPVIFLAYDLLEWRGEDHRAHPLSHRRATLESLVEQDGNWLEAIQLSPIVSADSWDELAELRDRSRERQVEGLMIKRRDAEYGVGRLRDCWWKWKVDPLTIDAVLIYAQQGHGRRASLFTDYTFAVWKDDQLVPFAKAYSGLTDSEIRQVDRFVKQNTQERFGPVRSVKPELVFELAFEGIQPSSRHKSGMAVRFPRILRWRQDKTAAEANRLEDLRHFLDGEDEQTEEQGSS